MTLGIGDTGAQRCRPGPSHVLASSALRLASAPSFPGQGAPSYSFSLGCFPPDLLWRLLPQVLTKRPLLREPSPWEQKLYSAPPPSPPSGRSSGSSPHPILPMVQQVLGIHHLFSQPVSAPEDPHPGVQGSVCTVHPAEQDPSTCQLEP